ncbi:NAD(P)-dependent oxidoreductase [Polynucleobacter sp. AP-Melu-500A-A1]|uniref:NAD-dependent epimerase/dehydratase family protein n=1 Tax=Polynucleobacter sp. AP-Melu-500A-A1 TaxID=2576929 RepID=UPI001C0AE9DD|nr:GDP-mannose 4,6-dehydratase [Polynucleobacter sp. AP-Melu-500A-A1]MBU3630033.1 GDP-mannose 4,6-dehydratase [Polynucleobacter sp. AP-Melu-500A-A1]
MTFSASTTPSSSPTLLVTGARGFTGIHITEMAQKQGIKVIALESNLNDEKALNQEIAQISPDYVAHLAGISFVASKDHEAFYRVHALGTSNLLQALTKLQTAPKKILLASSATVYGNSPNHLSVEDQPLTPIDHYAISKVAMEDMAKTFFNRLPIVIARPFNYTGPGQKGNFLIPKLVDHFAKRKSFIELGNLNIEREFNDVNMICDAYLKLLELGKANEIYNVCSGQARSLQFVVDTLKKITGHAIEIRVNPDFVRASEVHRMVGSPEKLKQLLAGNGLSLQIPALENTFKQMLDASSSSSA